jgi:hypothetical protein
MSSWCMLNELITASGLQFVYQKMGFSLLGIMHGLLWQVCSAHDMVRSYFLLVVLSRREERGTRVEEGVRRSVGSHLKARQETVM